MGRTKELFEQYREGEMSLLDVTLQAREIRKECEAEIELIKAFEYENLEHYEQYKGDPYMGFEFVVTNGRKTFDFSGCPSVISAQEQLKLEQESAKAAFELYQKKGQRPITEDGELIDLPEVNYSKSFLTIKKTKK